MKRIFIILLTGFLATSVAKGQVVPPGVGKTHTASWLAISFDQKLNGGKNSGWQSNTYFGTGRKSNRNSNNPLKDPSIFVVNQEFKNQFHKNLQYSLAVSYRRQNEYEDHPPYSPADPHYKNELRFYTRLSYSIPGSSLIQVSPSIRQEFQKYMNPDFSSYTKDLQLRTRFRLKFKMPVSGDKRQNLILSSEQLFASSHNIVSKKWSRFKYTDTRLALFYSISPGQSPLTFDLGYMCNLIGTGSMFVSNAFALSMTWENPFSSSRERSE